LARCAWLRRPVPEDLATLLRLTERYCVVFQTLASSPAISASYA
jgi:hypothetical protein